MDPKRSSRSRSKTPFSLSNEKEIQGLRVTRSSAHKSYESFSEDIVSHSSAKVNRVKTRVGNNVRGTALRIKTSDYSSEDNEEVTSTIIDQNRVNEVLDSSLSNGSKYAALKVYREAPEYWNRYPKTDYTYSRHSKDRVEIAPGVINMPNMSRKPLHGQHVTEYSDKITSTDSFYDQHDENLIQYETNLRRKLFANNNNKIQHSVSQKEITIMQRIYILIQSIFITISSFANKIVRTQDAWFISVFGLLHRAASRIMLADTWLLKGGNRNANKVVALCLLPLLFFGGLWLASTLSHAFNPTRLESAGLPLPLPDHLRPTQIVEKIIKIQLDSPVTVGFTNHQLQQMAESLKSSLDLDIDINTIKKIITNDPNFKRIDNVSPEKIASSLTDEQLLLITGALKKTLDMKYDVNHVIERVLESPSIQNLIEHYNFNGPTDKDSIIVKLLEEVNKLKFDLSNYNTRLSADVKKCCRRSFVAIESYVNHILKNSDEYVKKSELTDWLNAMFVAKEDLEQRIGNLTHNLKADFDKLIVNNGRHIMDEVALKLKRNHVGVIPGEDNVRQIVREVLAIYDADKTGLVDYALESAGGQIISTRCTQNYQSSSAVVSIWGIPLWYVKNTPRTIISPSVHPGECWSFQNFPGFLVIQLSIPISIEAFSYEHVSRSNIPYGNIDSAPKNFSVYGLREENDKEPYLIGDYIFDIDGEPLQYFAAEHPGVFNMIELRINSNHGNPKYTCLYRFRVHGKPYTEPT